MRTILAVLLCLAFSSLAIAALTQFTASVTGVSGGDTITVLTQDKQQIRIHLYGIDCPEKGQAFGNRATHATYDAVFGKQVTVEPIETDRYGRMVAIVIMPDGSTLNEQLVREGLAWVYTQYCKLDAICDQLRKLEQSVRMSRRGLWIDKNPVPPWEWRKGK